MCIMLSKILEVCIPLPYTVNVNKSVYLINDLPAISYDQYLKSASFDVTIKYSQVPSTDLINTIELICDQRDIKVEVETEIRRISQALTEQNYFKFQDKLYTQKALAVGASTSLFSEIYLQHMENTKIVDILLQHHTIGYFRYVDDILTVYKHGITNIHDVLNTFNNTMPTMNLTIDEEKEHKINLLTSQYSN